MNITWITAITVYAVIVVPQLYWLYLERKEIMGKKKRW